MIQFDSRKIKKGDTYVAIKGLTVDGHDFVNDAFKNGAKIVYGEKDIEKPNYVKVPNSRMKLGELCKDFYKDPSSKLKVIGVTGTKGKTTTCHIIHHILTNNNKKAGLISTISAQGFHTTAPDIVTLNSELSRMVKEGYEYVVLEVSSHGIDQGRIAGIKFDISVLTNIAPEHLDYHKTFKEYKRVKMMFVNSAQYRVFSPKTTKLKILEGDFNNINAETAIEVCKELGINESSSLKALKSFKLPEGRLEEINPPAGGHIGFRIFVDFAHTPDSLEVALKYLKTITKGKLISVFGCAGERDPRKRSRMAKISTEIADLSIFTSEDPRTENISKILNQMKSGVKSKKVNKYITISERGEAISYALSNAKKGDIVGIFGKGHEKTMCFDRFEHPWSDQLFIKNQLNGHDDLVGVILAGGKGKRMHSKVPKILNTIAGRPMISYSLENLRNAGIKNIIPVLGFKRHLIIARLSKNVNYAVQPKPLGTGNAVLNAFPKILPGTKTLLVINGDDSAFYTPKTIKNVIELHKKEDSTLTFVSLIQENPQGLGRVLRDLKGNLIGTVEEKNATENQKKIKEVNDGLYIFDYKWLRKNIFNIKKNFVAKEYYLPDLIQIALTNNDKVSVYTLPDSNEWQGINTQDQLKEAEEKMIKRLQLNG
jgi:UDP-N-acetylmuramoyl-L-alanyl-D-glutamate--2,6-diaminopimelate ligase